MLLKNDMEKILKYTLEIADEQILPIPSGSRVLTVQEQRGELCLWAVVDDTKQSTGKFKVKIFGTGNPLPVSLLGLSCDAPSGYLVGFVGTVQMSNGLVWHVFH